LWDIVVAPDVPGHPAKTIERTLQFAKVYSSEFMPVIQGGTVEEYRQTLEYYYKNNIISYTLKVDGRPLLGIGGLDGNKRRVAYVSKLLKTLTQTAIELGVNPIFHLFGIGIRILKGLAKRGLIKHVYSVDSSGWLAEIQFRRRTVHNAPTPIHANYAAIKTYVTKVLSLSSAAT
jgi:hypothetical protein